MKKQKKPLVSVVIPAYNAEYYLKESVESILKQTYKELEILIIDDKSTDRTLEIAEDLAKTDSRIRVISNPKNLGIGANRNLGIEESKGEFICWQDADDISVPDRIELQLHYLVSHPNVGIVGGFITFFNGKITGPTRTYREDDKSLKASMFRYTAVAQPAAMVRKECYEKVGLFNPSYTVAEDLEMLFRLGIHYEFANIQQVVLMYRQTEGSLTKNNLKSMELATLKLRKNYQKSSAYKYTIFDAAYNLAQRITIIMPYSLRLKLFQFIRGDR